VVPRRNWAKLRGLTLSLSDFLLVLCGRVLPDCFRAPDTSWKTTLKALGVKPQFSQQLFIGRSTEPMMPELCYKFGYLLTLWILRKPVRSLDLQPSLAASAYMTLSV